MTITDYDDYEVLYDFDWSNVESDSYREPIPIPDAFLACRRQLHVANIACIAELAHTTKLKKQKPPTSVLIRNRSTTTPSPKTQALGKTPRA